MSYRHKVDFQSYTEPVIQDVNGEPVPDWTTYATRTVKIEPVQGDEKEVGKSINAFQRYRIEMRYLNNLTTKHRIIWDGRILEINSVMLKHGVKRYQTVEATHNADTKQVVNQMAFGGVVVSD